MSTRPFLTARFEHLTLFTWTVPRSVLEPRLPRGCELDLLRGEACLSLVTLDFKDTRVLGLSWPGYRAFPDVNLRFYARRGDRRGCVFVRELVPQRFVAACARTLYGEPFDHAHIASVVREQRDRVAPSPGSAGEGWGGGSIRVERAIGYAGGVHTVWVEAEPNSALPGPDSDAHFFMEREWGFAHRRDGSTSITRIVHPPWHAYPVRRAWLRLDWAKVYGDEWAFLTGRQPDWMMLGRGSEISVYPPTQER